MVRLARELRPDSPGGMVNKIVVQEIIDVVKVPGWLEWCCDCQISMEWDLYRVHCPHCDSVGLVTIKSKPGYVSILEEHHLRMD